MRVFSRLVNSLPKRIAAVALALVIGFGVPVATIAASTVNIEATSGVGNVTAGDTQYSSSTNATYDQVVKIQVNYTNTEAASSGLVANDVHFKIEIPSTPGATQVVTTDVDGSNTNDVSSSVSVHLDNASEYLQYELGSSVAKVTAPDGTISEVSVPDASGPETSTGYLLNNGNPCQSASVTVLARVMLPGVKIVKQSEVLGQSNAWSNDNTAEPGQILKYLITYENTGNTEENNVAIGDNLPPTLTLIPGTTQVITGSGTTTDNTNNLTKGGIIIGNYAPGVTAYVEFEAQIPSATQMACGQTEFRNVGIAQPQGMNEYYNTAITDVTNGQCAGPVDTCNTITVTQPSGNTIDLSSAYTANNGATFQSVTYNFGDGTTPLTTSNTTQSYTYAQAGTYTVTATMNFSVNGSSKSVSNASCSQTITIAAPAATPTTPATPTQLANTGPGDVIGLFGGTTAVAAVGHRLFRSRFARK
jgi:uncharacterized repeat protein (TIGR01451 family)